MKFKKAIALTVSALLTFMNMSNIVMAEEQQPITDGIQKINAHNLKWTPVSRANQLGGADDFSGIFFNELKDFNETGGPIAAGTLKNVKIVTFDAGYSGGINQFNDILIPKFNIGVMAQKEVNIGGSTLISNGDAVIGNSVDPQKLSTKVGNIYKRQSEIDKFLGDAKADLVNLNKNLWYTEQTDKAIYDGNTVILNCIDGINIFEVDLTSGRKNIQFNYPEDAKDSTIIIKYKGNVINYGETFIGTTMLDKLNVDEISNRVIWTFDPSLTDVKIDRTIVFGSILAPNADITFSSAGYSAINGTIIANGLDGSGSSSEIHWVGPFKGDILTPIEKLGNFEFNKLDNYNRAVNGATFALYQDGVEKYTVTSTESGLVSFSGIKEGTYTLKEASAPDGYEISKSKIEVIVSDKGTVTFKENGVIKTEEDLDLLYVNNISKVNFSFNKVVAGTDTRIPNVEFKLMQEGKEIATAVSDENGVVSFDNIEMGSYALVETAPDGYKAAGPWTVTVTENGATIDGKNLTQIENVENIGAFQFNKLDNHGKNVKEATFALYQDDVEKYTTTSTELGLVSFNDIKQGTYILKEVSAPDGYEVSNATVEVTVDKDGKVTFKVDDKDQALEDLNGIFINNVSKVEFAFNKVIAETETGIPNVEFKLLQGDKLIATAVSDENGVVSFNNVELGTYTLVEATPAGYKAAGPWTINVTKEGATIDGVLLTEIENEKIIEKTGLFQFNKKDNHGNAVNGAIFALYQDGELKYTVTSTDAGIVSFNDVKEGTYTLKETSAPDGYEISKATVEVIVNSEGTVTFRESGVVKTLADLEDIYINKVILGSVSFTKYINDKKGILAGAEFELLINGERYGSTIFSDLNGLVTFLNVKPGEYQIREVSSHSKYFKASDKVFTVVVDENGVSSLIGDAKTEAETIFINKVENSIEFIKYSDSKSVLSNATFELLKGTEVIATSISDKNGVVRFENILPGEYIVGEKSAPKGYIKSQATRKLVVKDNGEISITASEIKEWEEAFKNKKVVEPKEEKPDKKEEITIPKTSDDANVIFPIITAIISLAGIVFIKRIKH